MRAILWIVRSPSFASLPVRIVGYRRGQVPYLAIVHDKTEASGDRLERTEGISGFLDPIKNQSGPGRCEGLEVQFVFVHRTWIENWIRSSLVCVFYFTGFTGRGSIRA